MRDFPTRVTQPQAGVGPLSESEEEAEEEEDAGGAEPIDAASSMAKAVTQLTKIVRNLSDKRKEPTSLEGLLDRAESGFDFGSAGASSSSSGARSKAAALRALQKAVVQQPQAISASILTAMEEDLLARRSSGASAGQVCTARAWFEHRSRVSYFPTTIRIGWSICGAIDLLKEGRPDEALCRLLLLLNPIDQSAIDAGSWALSQEALLETTGPPFGAFQRRPHVDTLEVPHTKLLESRWVELMVHKLKEKESYLEMRKKIGKPNAPPPPIKPESAAAQDGAEEAPGTGGGRGRGRRGRGRGAAS